MARIVRVKYLPRECLECGSEFVPVRSDQIYCTVRQPRFEGDNRGGRCKDIAHARALSRAWTIYSELYHHTLTSDAKLRGESLGAIMSKAREWRDEDRAKGIAPPAPSERMRTKATQERYRQKLVANKAA